MIVQNTIAKNLKRLRHQFNYPLDIVARESRLDAAVVSQLESGTIEPSVWQLNNLARVYGQNFGALIGTESLSEFPQILHRSTQNFVNRIELDLEITKVLNLLKTGFALRSEIGSKLELTVPINEKIVKSSSQAITQAKSAAKFMRQKLNLIGTIGDLFSLFNHQGIWVVAMPMNDKISGLFINSTDQGIAIVVNSNHSLLRQRASLAHEFAHVIFDRAELSRISTDNESDLIEKRANAFSAHFLMPKSEVDSWLKILAQKSLKNSKSEDKFTPAMISQLAMNYRVSYDLANGQLRNLGYYGASDFEDFKDRRPQLDDITKTKSNSDESKLSYDLKNQILRLSLAAYKGEKISLGRLVEIGAEIGKDREELLNHLKEDAFQ